MSLFYILDFSPAELDLFDLFNTFRISCVKFAIISLNMKEQSKCGKCLVCNFLHGKMSAVEDVVLWLVQAQKSAMACVKFLTLFTDLCKLALKQMLCPL